ncbi:hypothetical protein I3J27_38835 [Bradyrhizobium xenonodulans]|uniref:Uncharacterized protein n=1 Tax=Bradyrhizobium xenonodulans TaxID=2736875 RepID=A0ABY7MMI6_9BRAD|nr:hypothetical protein [Bradyrhizobium xenonodulans]WBL78821.1 hypothetical protein I3J27_38835 [Bradyrhizobium xenonodulans]
MADFVPKGFYALERAVLLIARELNESLWDHAKMTLSEINAYERLGETAHYKDLRRTLEGIELSLRDRKTGELPDDSIEERFKAYQESQKLLRTALNAGELQSVLQFVRTGERFDQPAEAWAQENAMSWFDDGLTYVETGGTHLVLIPPFVPGAPLDVNFQEIENGVWASIEDSFSDWYYSASGPMADVEVRERDKGGRPLEYDWDAVKEYALGLVKQHGRPGRTNKRLPSKSQLAEAVMNEWARKGVELAEPTVRRYITTWLKDL